MKQKNTIQTKRRPAKRSGIRFLQAKTSQKKSNQRRKQHAAMSASGEGELGAEVPRLGVTGALLIILALHVLIIAAILINARSTSDDVKLASSDYDAQMSAAGDRPDYQTVEADMTTIQEERPIHFVKVGDTYARIAVLHGVDEDLLRQANPGKQMRSGNIIKIPPRQVVAERDAEMERRRRNARSGRDVSFLQPQPQVQNIAPVNYEPVVQDQPVSRPPTISTSQRATQNVLVPQARETRQEPAPVATRKHTVKSGESIWRISKQYKVSQDALLHANGNLDPRKLRVGMKLSIPAN